MATIKQEIARAKTVEVLLDNAYTDNLASLRLRVSKPEARRIVDAAPKDGQPTAKWEDDNLLLVPNAKDIDA
jgi:hypothetical protein